MKITAMSWYLWSIPLVFSIPQRSHHHYDAVELEIKEDSEAHDASMNLPHQPPAAPGPKDAAAHRHLQQKPLMRPVSKDAAASEVLPVRSPTALDSGAHDASVNLPHQPSAQLKGSKDDAAHRHLQQKPLMHPGEEEKDEENEDSLDPEVAEENITEEEIAEANDETELSDDFLISYLSNEDLETETEEETSDH